MYNKINFFIKYAYEIIIIYVVLLLLLFFTNYIQLAIINIHLFHFSKTYADNQNC